ncbi:hypothetical protein [Nitratireductor soli]|uniref:hypothetical protein n=1 Tax=Nitratireductor soli TaxID=1670619 RepID=UPI00065DF8A0|nr:hypothetical protein [Nitratireductor soli]
MLFKQAILEGIARGEVRLAFRRWKRPSVVAGTPLRTALGTVRIGNVAPIAETELNETAAQSAGYASLAALRQDLRSDGERTLYRIEIDGIEADRRVALRENTTIDTADFTALTDRFQRWDAACGRDAYHRRILEAIAREPAARAADLAALLGVEKLKFKRDVRKLKELGLTESLDVGYRLSPRGERVLRMIEGEPT